VVDHWYDKVFFYYFYKKASTDFESIEILYIIVGNSIHFSSLTKLKQFSDNQLTNSSIIKSLTEEFFLVRSKVSEEGLLNI
jgi:hypothetical protein